MSTSVITYSEIERRFDYNPITGLVTYKRLANPKTSGDTHWNNAYAGKTNLTKATCNGRIFFNSEGYSLLKMIWLRHTGNMPRKVYRLKHEDNLRWLNISESNFGIKKERRKRTRAKTVSDMRGVAVHARFSDGSIRYIVQCNQHPDGQTRGYYYDLNDAKAASKIAFKEREEHRAKQDANSTT